MMDWTPPEKPAELAESRLICAIIDGTFPPGNDLPAERDLAVRIGVTRPTLREALQRLKRDGWLDIQQGKPTRVRNFLEDGKLGVLSVLAENPAIQSQDFVQQLLAVRLALAPAFTADAVKHQSAATIALFEQIISLPDDSNAYAQADWQLQHHLALSSQNQIYTLILNGFKDLFLQLALRYFAIPEARAHSRNYYQNLHQAFLDRDETLATDLTKQIMSESIQFWKLVEQNQ